MFDFGAGMGVGYLDQILQPSLWRLWCGTAFAWPHCNSEMRCGTYHLVPFGDALVASIAIHHLLIALQQLAGLSEFMHDGCSGHNRVDQTGVLVDADMDLHPEIPLVALLSLVHLWIALPLFVFGGAGGGDQGGIDDRALPHRHAPCAEVGFDDLKDLIAQIVLLKQVAEGQDRGLIRGPH